MVHVHKSQLQSPDLHIHIALHPAPLGEDNDENPMPSLPPNTTPAPTLASVFKPAMSPAVQKPSPRNGPAQEDSTAADFELPKLLFEVRDLKHPGAKLFFDSVNSVECTINATKGVLRLLYVSPHDSTTTVPTTRSITLILRAMPGVAYTKGSDLDNDHKETHFSLSYIAGVSSDRTAAEINGVVVHEFVHALQYNGFGTCPGGLIEGIADWVRLNLDLAPPHWKREAGDKWDAGYQTTAYFLDYLEQRFGAGSVRRINEKLRVERYHEDSFWLELFGESVSQLWEAYATSLKDNPKESTA